MRNPALPLLVLAAFGSLAGFGAQSRIIDCDVAARKCALLDSPVFVTTNSVVTIHVFNYRLRSRFTADAVAHDVPEDIPDIRGIDRANIGSNPAAAGQKGGEAASQAIPFTKWIDLCKPMVDAGKSIEVCIQQQLETMETGLQAARAQLEKAVVNVRAAAPDCSDRTSARSSPGFDLCTIESYAKTLKADLDQSHPLSPVGRSFEAKFDNLTERADLLVKAVKAWNDANGNVAREFLDAWQVADATVTNYDISWAALGEFRDTVKKARDSAKTLGVTSGNQNNAGPNPPNSPGAPAGNKSSGDARILQEMAASQVAGPGKPSPTASRIKDLLNRVKPAGSQSGAHSELGALNPRFDELNDLLNLIFDGLNGIYESTRIDDKGDPLSLWLGTWPTNQAVYFTLSEHVGFLPYGYDQAIAVAAKPAGQQTPNGDPANIKPQTSGSKGDTAKASTAAAASNGKKDNSATPVPKDDPGQVVADYNFEVHRLVRANVISGFALSTLRNNSYAVHKDVSSTTPSAAAGTSAKSADASTPAPPVTPILAASDRPQVHYFTGLNFYLVPRDLYKTPRWQYFTPGVMFAYGLDEPYNFYTGLNWETKWGLNFAVGGHIGRVKYARPDVVLNQPSLPSDTTDVPTVDRTKLGAYVSAGFDLAVFKSIWGQITGGNNGGSSGK
jgi:hypothetical protein